MDQITPREIDTTLEKFQILTDRDVVKLIRTFQKKQEPLLVYIAAVSEREELNEQESDILMTMTLLSWELFRKKFPRLRKISVQELERLDNFLYDALQNHPESALMSAKSSPQPQLLARIFESVLESEEEVREEIKGIICLTLKNVVDGLSHACR